MIFTLIWGGIWYYVYRNLSPYLSDSSQINLFSLFLFLGSFGAALAGLATLVGYQLRYWFNPRGNTARFYQTSLRQGILLSGGIIFLMLLSITDVLNYFTLGFSLVAIIALEWFFH